MISPIVRKLASDNDIDLSLLSGSGAGGGVITRADVEAGANFGPETETSHATDQRIPIKGLRKVVADKLSTSRREIPDATTWVDVDATELLAARAEINKSLPDSDKISLMALLARLTIAALAQYPELNSSVDTARGEIVRHARTHLGGIAAQTPKGLMVPVIRNADA